MSIFADIEDQAYQALEPMLASNGGPLNALRKFRGSIREWQKHYKDKRPCGLIGIFGDWNRIDGRGPTPDLVASLSVFLFEDHVKGEQAAVEGVTAMIDEEEVVVSPGLYELIEDAAALLDRAAFRVAGVPMIPTAVTGGSIQMDEDTSQWIGLVRLTASIPCYPFSTALAGGKPKIL